MSRARLRWRRLGCGALYGCLSVIVPPSLDDPDRLEALHRLGILDGPRDPAYDQVVQLASKLCEAPIALITFVDRDRQWFKARVGLELDQTDAEISFCGHAIGAADNGLLVVSDASIDPRFADSPLVIGTPHIAAYAGKAINAPTGEPIGTVCVIDDHPREWTVAQLDVLVGLAGIVDQLIAKHPRPEPTGPDPMAFADLMLATVHDGVVIQDIDGRIVRWNSAAEVALGLSADEINGRTSLDPRWRAIRPDGSVWAGDTHPAMQVLRTHAEVHDQTMGIDQPDRGLVWLRVNSTPIVDGHGTVTGVLTTFVDLTSTHKETIPTGQPTKLSRNDREQLIEHFDRLVAAMELTNTTLTIEVARTEAIVATLRQGGTPSAAISTVNIPDGRDQLSTALSTLEEARRLARAAMFRALLDDGATVAELATGWGISKQLIYRTIAKSEQPTHG
jgi:PAS domain S-box-containing protein